MAKVEIAEFRKPLFSVTRNDFRRDTFKCPGNGGQKVNKTSAGVRLTHIASGAVGSSCATRSQHKNQEDAFNKLLETKEWKTWFKVECARQMGQVVAKTEDEVRAGVDKEMKEGLKAGRIVEEVYEV